MKPTTVTWMMPTGETYEWNGTTFTHAVIFHNGAEWMIHTSHKTAAAAARSLKTYRSTYQGHTSEAGYVWGEAQTIEGNAK